MAVPKATSLRGNLPDSFPNDFEILRTFFHTNFNLSDPMAIQRDQFYTQTVWRLSMQMIRKTLLFLDKFNWLSFSAHRNCGKVSAVRSVPKLQDQFVRRPIKDYQMHSCVPSKSVSVVHRQKCPGRPPMCSIVFEFGLKFDFVWIEKLINLRQPTIGPATANVNKSSQ